MRFKIVRYAIILGLVLLAILASFTPYATTGQPIFRFGPRPALASGNGTVDDPNIQYFGRWDMTYSPSVVKGYWPGVYFRVNFAGTSTIGVQITSAVNIYASIDGGSDVLYSNASGAVTLATGLSLTSHTLRVATRTESDVLRFEGLIMDISGVNLPPSRPRPLLEFLGTSIPEAK